MKQRMLSVLVFALVVAGAASFIVYRLISSKLATSAQASTMRIVVAARDLPIGVLIKDTDLTNSEFSGAPPRGSIMDANAVVGRGVVAAIYQGEPLLESRLAPKGAGAGLAAIIPQGMRAVALRVNEVVGVAGFVTPGMRVDILVAGNPPGNSGSQLGTLTKTVLQNIEVLSAGQNIQKDAEGKPVTVTVVNLLVTPEQAEILSLASNETRIQLVLRNPLDNEIAKTPGTALARIFNPTASPGPDQKAGRVRSSVPKPAPTVVRAVVAEAPERIVVPITVEVLHGSRKAEVKFSQEKETLPSEAKN